jgi:hypothetical protein
MKRTNTVGFHSHEAPRGLTFIKIERRRAVARACGGDSRGFRGDRVSVL